MIQSGANLTDMWNIQCVTLKLLWEAWSWTKGVLNVPRLICKSDIPHIIDSLLHSWMREIQLFTEKTWLLWASCQYYNILWSTQEQNYMINFFSKLNTYPPNWSQFKLLLKECHLTHTLFLQNDLLNSNQELIINPSTFLYLCMWKCEGGLWYLVTIQKFCEYVYVPPCQRVL